jgi:hypothetical protein
MSQNLAPQIPLYDDGKLSFNKIRELLDLSAEEVATIIDISASTVREGQVSAKTLKKAQPLLYVLNMLWRLLEGKDAEIRRWLKEPRVEWYGMSPLDALSMGKADAVIQFLQRSIEGEISGS